MKQTLQRKDSSGGRESSVVEEQGRALGWLEKGRASKRPRLKTSRMEANNPEAGAL